MGLFNQFPAFFRKCMQPQILLPSLCCSHQFVSQFQCPKNVVNSFNNNDHHRSQCNCGWRESAVYTYTRPRAHRSDTIVHLRQQSRFGGYRRRASNKKSRRQKQINWIRDWKNNCMYSGETRSCRDCEIRYN